MAYYAVTLHTEEKAMIRERRFTGGGPVSPSIMCCGKCILPLRLHAPPNKDSGSPAAVHGHI